MKNVHACCDMSELFQFQLLHGTLTVLLVKDKISHRTFVKAVIAKQNNSRRWFYAQRLYILVRYLDLCMVRARVTDLRLERSARALSYNGGRRVLIPDQ